MKIVRKEDYESLMKMAKEAEWYETPQWSSDRILDVELCTPLVVDPCAGRGVLGHSARNAGYRTLEYDINGWPDPIEGSQVDIGVDFTKRLGHEIIKEDIEDTGLNQFTVFMNPPFSLTTDFIQTAFGLGARKVIMFQRLAFLESGTRRKFFEKYPPARIWLCGDRAVSWRGDIPAEDMLVEYFDDDGQLKTETVKGRKGRSTPTPHAWFVWEKSHRGLEAIHHLYKDDV